MTSRVVVAAAAALALAGPAEAARYAVGVEPGVPYERVASAVEHATATRADRTLEPLGAVVAETTSPARLRALPGVAYVERTDAARRTAFVPNDPLAPRQWHLAHDRAFDFWPELPALPGVRVAVIDSGIDATHPDLAARVAESRTFVGGSALTDQQGHGTFIAGLIAAQTNNALGVAGMAFPAQLLVAKVVRANRGVVVEAEAQAIRWAVDNGARVINLSLGGLRDPRDTSRDQFSELEAAAIRYAYTRGVVVVAAIGNSDLAPTSPWPYASYPAALPHVIGVSALAKDGSVPLFSNRDPVYNDVAAPGQELVSTLPRQLTAGRTGCEEQGYSPCGPEEYRNAEGTSFAAPQVAAAAALLLSVRPLLQPSQVAHLLTRNAEDASDANGCRACARGRDAYTGFGRLDVAKALGALQSPLPAPDRFESNDDAGAQAPPLRMQRASFTATVDFWDDQVDVYKVYLRKRQRITITLTGPRGMNTDLVLWKPGTTRVNGLSVSLVRQRAAQSASAGPNERIRHTASSAGWYFVQVKAASAGAGQYRLAFAKR